jgi:release factor glutamine methyltransferase
MTSTDHSVISAVRTNDDVWTIQRIIQWSTGFLKDKNVTESPRLEAEILLAHALGCKRIQLYTSFDKPVTSQEREPFKASLKRRVTGEPVAYITGERDFMSLTFRVTPDVLIPRPDTETLVETVIERLQDRSSEELRILDVGTGSGCIAISLAKKLPVAVVTAWDISEKALAVARDNAVSNEVSNVMFSNRNALDAGNWNGSETFDVIVSNPPYIAHSEKSDLSPSVRDYEPHEALFADVEGLEFYREFAERARKALNPGGFLAVEIGYRQAEKVSDLLRANGWSDVQVVKDLGKNDRVVIAEL